MGRSGIKYIVIMLVAIVLLVATVKSPEQTLSAAMFYMQMGQIELATENFEEAIKSGMLNDIGRSIVYWNLYAIYTSDINKASLVGDTLLSFLVSAKIILDSNDIGDKAFVKNFSLHNKYKIGEKNLEVLWKKHNGSVLSNGSETVP